MDKLPSFTQEQQRKVNLVTLSRAKEYSGKLHPVHSLGEKVRKNTARFPSRKSTRLPNPVHVLGCKHTASFCRGSLPWSPTGAEGGLDRCHWPTFAAKEQLPPNDSLKCSCNDEASAKAKQEMNRNTRSHPEPSVPLRSFLLFYKLTYCSKTQIFRNSTG